MQSINCFSFSLVALGLEQFKPFVLDKENTKHKYKTYLLHDVIRLTRIYLLPARDSNAIYGLIKKYENPHTEGPVRVSQIFLFCNW